MPFKKGNPGGNGRPPVSELEKKAREAGRQGIAEAYLVTEGKTALELETLAKDPKQPAVVVLMASNMIKGITTGDWSIYDKQLDRVIGKVKQAVEITGEGGGPLEVKFSNDLGGF